MFRRFFIRSALALAFVAAVTAPSAVSAQAKSDRGGERGGEGGGTARIDPDQLLGAVVQVKNRALSNARSNATLGRERIGTGIVIDDQGLVLTIGYIVLEPDALEVTTANGRTLPATLAAYDHATGFGLLRTQAPPADMTPMRLGDSGKLSESEPVMILPFGGREAASVARVMSVRPSTFSWEYQLDGAIYTAPPSMQWAGAALVNREGRLVGIGSLLVRDTVRPGTPSPGNMFVPIDILKPIFAELIATGKRGGAQRPWLGLATEEVQGRLLVTRVSPGAPAELAGVRQGDIVVSVAGEPVSTHAAFYRRMWSLGAAGIDVPIKLRQGDADRDVQVKSIDRADYFEKKPGT